MTNIVYKTTLKSYDLYIFLGMKLHQDVSLRIRNIQAYVRNDFIAKFFLNFKSQNNLSLYVLSTCDVIMDYYQNIEHHLQILIHKLLLFGF